MNGMDARMERVRRAVEARMGLDLTEDSARGTVETLLKRIEMTGYGTRPDAYAELIADDARGRDERTWLAEHLTVGETSFFRMGDQLRAFARSCIPSRIRARGPGAPLRLLSAACATGEEPYTLAMLLAEDGFAPGAVEIVAADINPAALARAARGVYSEWALRETPHASRDRWFKRVRDGYEVSPDLKRAVRFVQQSLLDDGEIWRAHHYDVIYCRNVLMYFTREAARSVVSRIAHSLAPGGFFFMGHAETLRGLSQEFFLQHAEGAFFYQVRSGGAPLEPPGRPAGGTRSAGSAGNSAWPMVDVEPGGSWADAIRASHERVAKLALGQAQPGPSAPPLVRAAPAAPPPFPPAPPRAAPDQATADDADAQLLEAVLSTERGDVARARAVSQALLARDDTNAAAHYVMALCAEQAGEPREAELHDRMACHLEPRFAMPALHLGMLLRRRGENAEAREVLARAAALLETEDPSRVILFGGGFGRKGLTRLCSEALAALQGAPR